MSGLRVYVSAPFPAAEFAYQRCAELDGLGYTVTCTWPTSEAKSDADATTDFLADAASSDLAELQRCDVLVAFTAAAASIEGPAAHRGGRHVELGYFLGLADTAPRHRPRRVVLVGEPENAFHHVPAVEHVDTWREALVLLGRILVDHHRTELEQERNLPRTECVRGS